MAQTDKPQSGNGETPKAPLPRYALVSQADAIKLLASCLEAVRLQLNNGKLTPAGHIPPASSSSGLSRF